MENEIADAMLVCESWNWNCSPKECAIEAGNRGWTIEKTASAMKQFGFSKRDISAVKLEMSKLGHVF